MKNSLTSLSAELSLAFFIINPIEIDYKAYDKSIPLFSKRRRIGKNRSDIEDNRFKSIAPKKHLKASIG